MCPVARSPIRQDHGGLRLVVSGPANLKQALNEAMQFDGPALVNVLIDPPAGRRPQQFSSLGYKEIARYNRAHGSVP